MTELEWKALVAEHKRTRELEHVKVTAFVIGAAVMLFLGTFVATFNR